MKKYISAFAAVLMVITACSKTEIPVETPKPVKMTLTASIGADTKVSYVEEGNVLKSAWEQYDKVSLIAVNSVGEVLSNDIFTTQSAGNTANFTGTFTNDANTAKVLIYYPPLLEGEGTEEEPWMSPSENGYSSEGVINGVKKGNIYMSLRSGYYLQKGNGNVSHICQYSVLVGEAVMDGNNFTTTLEHQAYIVKATLTLPAGSGYDLRRAQMRLYNSEGMSKSEHPLSYTAWRYAATPSQKENGGPMATISMAFGDVIDSGSGTGVILGGNTAIVYFVGFGEAEINKDDYCYITVEGYKGEDQFEYSSGAIVFTSDRTINNGKMYRVSAEVN